MILGITIGLFIGWIIFIFIAAWFDNGFVGGIALTMLVAFIGMLIFRKCTWFYRLS